MAVLYNRTWMGERQAERWKDEMIQGKVVRRHLARENAKSNQELSSWRENWDSLMDSNTGLYLSCLCIFWGEIERAQDAGVKNSAGVGVLWKVAVW